MAKKLTDVTNPITASGGNILSLGDWVSRILWVAMFGAVFSLGAKVLTTVDNYIPGNNTPSSYRSATSTISVSGPTVY